MPFEGRTKDEVLRNMLARAVAQGPATDAEDGGVMATYLGTVAEEFEDFEERAETIQKSFTWDNITGSDIDARLADLNTERKGALPASGTVQRFHRQDTTQSLTVQAGVVVSKSTNSKVKYLTTQAFTMAIGEASYPVNADDPGVGLVCLTPGELGNAGVGDIDVIVNGPDGLNSTDNTNNLVNGTSGESDAEAIKRGKLKENALTRSVPSALSFVALDFEASNGTRAKHVKVFEFPEMYGYTEIVVDDGNAFSGFLDKGQETTGTVPTNGQRQLWHRKPAIAAIDQITINGATVPVSDGSTDRWISHPERGVIYVAKDVLSSGDTWAIKSYVVHTGFVAELQQEVEGTLLDKLLPGWRASGTRVVVTLPTIQEQSYQAQLVAEPGVALADIIPLVNATIIAYHLELAPGEPVILFDLCQEIGKIEGVLNFRLLNPTDDVYPLNHRTEIRTRAPLIDLGG